MKYDIGDVVLVKQCRVGDFYVPKRLSGIGIITELYDSEFELAGYVVMIAGSVKTYFVTDRDIEKKFE